MKSLSSICLCILLLCMIASGQSTDSRKATITFTSLSYPGARWTVAYVVNNRGWIVGYYGDSLGLNHGLLYRNNSYRSFDFPEGTNTNALGINDLGEIVGIYQGVDGLTHGFLRTEVGFIRIDYPGAANTLPYKINSADEIVGFFQNPGSSDGQGFEYQSGQFTAINYPGASGTAAYGINNKGQIVGSYSSGSGTSGFIDDGGAFTSITVPDTDNPTLTGITDKGLIVGWGQFDKHHTLVEQGFLDLQGTFRQLIYPSPATSTVVLGVNDRGQIVGTYYADAQYGFIVTISSP